jgi:hypothetical protein
MSILQWASTNAVNIYDPFASLHLGEHIGSNPAEERVRHVPVKFSSETALLLIVLVRVPVSAIAIASCKTRVSS